MNITEQEPVIEDFNKTSGSSIRIIKVRKLPSNEPSPIPIQIPAIATPPMPAAPRLWVKKLPLNDHMTKNLQPKIIRHTVAYRTVTKLPTNHLQKCPKPISTNNLQYGGINDFNNKEEDALVRFKVYPSAQPNIIHNKTAQQEKILNNNQLIEVFPSAFGTRRHYVLNQISTTPPLPNEPQQFEKIPKALTKSPPSKVKIIPADMVKLKQLMQQSVKLKPMKTMPVDSKSMDGIGSTTVGPYKRITINNPRILYTVPANLAKLIMSKRTSLGPQKNEEKAVFVKDTIAINQTAEAAVSVKIEESEEQSEQIDLNVPAGSADNAATLVSIKNEVNEQDENLQVEVLGEFSQPLSSENKSSGGVSKQNNKKNSPKSILRIERMNRKKQELKLLRMQSK
jgi:hypothetical protein